MKFLKSLLGKDRETTLASKIRPASERPPARQSQPVTPAEPATEAAPAAPKPAAHKNEPHPFLDDPMLSTMSLEVDLSSDEDNPYSTHSWAKGPENETRKLKTIQIGAKTEKKPSADSNPYDTGKMRRSWKR